MDEAIRFTRLKPGTRCKHLDYKVKDLNPIKRLRLVNGLAGLMITILCCALVIPTQTTLAQLDPTKAAIRSQQMQLDAERMQLNAENVRRDGELAATAIAKATEAKSIAMTRLAGTATRQYEIDLDVTATAVVSASNATATGVAWATATGIVAATATRKAEIAATSTRQREMVIEDLRNKAEQDAANLRRVRIVGYSLLLVIGAFFMVPFGRWVIVVLWPRIQGGNPLQGGKPTVMYTATILPAPAADERPMSDAEAVDATRQSVRDFQVDIQFDEPRREMEDLADLLRQHGTAPEGMR